MIGCNQYKRKYLVIEKPCPVCGTLFQTKQGHKREKTTCSHSCSNTFFASLRNKEERYKQYRTICFKNWPKSCILCGFDKVVEVHHLDNNHKNNDKNNLVPLCPNHHRMIHTKRWKDEVILELDSKIRGVA